MKHGGTRGGAGRKPAPAGQARIVRKSLRVSGEVGAYLDETGTGWVEDVIRNSQHFKDWQERRQNQPPPEQE